MNTDKLKQKLNAAKERVKQFASDRPDVVGGLIIGTLCVLEFACGYTYGQYSGKRTGRAEGIKYTFEKLDHEFDVASEDFDEDEWSDFWTKFNNSKASVKYIPDHD